MLEGKNIIITGGCGFIGSHLVDRLSKSNNVVVIDNLHSSNDHRNPNVKYLYGSFTEVIDSYDKASCDLLFHLGEYARVEQSTHEFLRCMNLNFGPMANVLDFCNKMQCKLIYSGSSTKFSDMGSGRNLSPYTWSKAINTELVVQYAKWYRLNFAICYFYNVYGEREIADGQYATVIAKFLKANKAGNKVQITAPGTQYRNFTHIEDTIDGLELVAEYGDGDDYCLANPKTHSILDIVKHLQLEHTLTREVSANRSGPSDISQKIYDIGWSPKNDLMDYLTMKTR